MSCCEDGGRKKGTLTKDAVGLAYAWSTSRLENQIWVPQSSGKVHPGEVSQVLASTIQLGTDGCEKTTITSLGSLPVHLHQCRFATELNGKVNIAVSRTWERLQDVAYELV